MMGRLTAGQAQFFYAFHLDEVVPADHVVRRIDAARSWLDPQGACAVLQQHRTPLDRPGTDDQNAAGRLRVCDPVGAADPEQSIRKPSPSVTTNSLCRLAT